TRPEGLAREHAVGRLWRSRRSLRRTSWKLRAHLLDQRRERPDPAADCRTWSDSRTHSSFTARKRCRYRADDPGSGGAAGSTPAPGRIAPARRLAHGIVLHGLFDRLARSRGWLLEISLRARLEALSTLRCLRRSRRDAESRQ